MFVALLVVGVVICIDIRIDLPADLKGRLLQSVPRAREVNLWGLYTSLTVTLKE